MREENKLIFWSKARDESFDEAAERTYALLQMLREHGEEVYPRYQGKRRKNKIPFEWTLENFKKAFRKGGDHSSYPNDKDVGYSMWFLSTPEVKTQAVIMFMNGVRSPLIQNTLSIELSPDYCFYSEENRNSMEQVFRKCIDLFDPYWAAVINSRNIKRPEYNRIPRNKVVHWLNYWGPEQIEGIREDQMEKAPVLAVERWHRGYLLKLQESPIRDSKEEDFQRQLQANRYFGL